MFFTNSAQTSSSNVEKLDLENGNTLRILTFNTWYFGKKVENGLDKIVKHIKLLKPDIVALQEIQTASLFKEFLKKLGTEWSGITTPNEYPDIGIITKHTIDDKTLSITPCNKSMGVNIQLKNSSEIISFWGMHLDHHSYGPYAANNRLVTKMEQIFSGESTKNKTGRQDNIHELLQTKEFMMAIEDSGKIPVIVAGDFNTPSHLDWIKENKEIHAGWIIQWPATYLLHSKTGLIDSFREIYPSPIETPGDTWTTINRYGPEWDFSIPDTLDRIDYILYKSRRLKPFKSFVYSGNELLQQVPNHEKNDYPSDHNAVVTDFSWVT
uniref:Endonuclease/exonuclease/phosphatase domain-containing protein n=1 Tax=Panagrolaimus sp. ES5 TaxID=591445 RepID=A0AC34FA71_9BILA